MKYTFKNPETGDIKELTDKNTPKDFKKMYDERYKLLLTSPETKEDEDMFWGDKPPSHTHMKINDL